MENTALELLEFILLKISFWKDHTNNEPTKKEMITAMYAIDTVLKNHAPEQNDSADTKSQCICRSYHERTGDHVADCPCR